MINACLTLRSGQNCNNKRYPNIEIYPQLIIVLSVPPASTSAGKVPEWRGSADRAPGEGCAHLQGSDAGESEDQTRHQETKQRGNTSHVERGTQYTPRELKIGIQMGAD